eukprot:CAMPEP_0168419588 /NCGR_PEP_ID=MMETSP0228-20121227/32344_1 /TAXON_ID=133427 /ORGANISM="Protoceratium reticulatum, Strain CCCM 535 (=CCMP 1889)" /LENGTH=64 /DNA_ID=CAMNT_0008433471 /DNA_START=65 /DNA_END=256 /DNA_ORIENTATION=+
MIFTVATKVKKPLLFIAPLPGRAAAARLRAGGRGRALAIAALVILAPATSGRSASCRAGADAPA